jgi:hypothetical protein
MTAGGGTGSAVIMNHSSFWESSMRCSTSSSSTTPLRFLSARRTANRALKPANHAPPAADALPELLPADPAVAVGVELIQPPLNFSTVMHSLFGVGMAAALQSIASNSCLGLVHIGASTTCSSFHI